MLHAIAVALLLFPGAMGPPLPPGTGEGDFVEIGGEVYQAHGGVLYTLDDPALDDPAHTVTVTASRVDSDDSKRVIRTEVVSAEAIRESGARTLAEVLSEEAGIQVNSSLGLGQEVQMDGLDGRHVLILVDGRPVNGRTNNRVDVSRLPVDASSIERIEIVRGPMSALYGSEALGGVVNIISRKAQARLGLEAEAQTRAVTGAVWQTLGAHARGGVGPLALRLDVTANDLPSIDRGGRDPITGAAAPRADGKPDLPDRRQVGAHAEAAVPLPGTFTARLQADGSASQSVARTSPVAPFRDRATGTEGSAAFAVDGEPWPFVELHGDVRVDRYAHVFDKIGGAVAGPPFCSPGGLPTDSSCAGTPDPRTRAIVC